jgi:hypothetical protein
MYLLNDWRVGIDMKFREEAASVQFGENHLLTQKLKDGSQMAQMHKRDALHQYGCWLIRLEVLEVLISVQRRALARPLHTPQPDGADNEDDERLKAKGEWKKKKHVVITRTQYESMEPSGCSFGSAPSGRRLPSARIILDRLEPTGDSLVSNVFTLC